MIKGAAAPYAGADYDHHCDRRQHKQTAPGNAGLLQINNLIFGIMAAALVVKAITPAPILLVEGIAR